jgi:NTP pyrophosphatase (non-canonical NTP hydrolase)
MPTNNDRFNKNRMVASMEASINDFDYLTESARTASGKFHGKFVDFDKFTEVLTQFMYASQQLDRYKKLLFYGEDSNKSRFRDNPSSGRDGYSIVDFMSTDNETEIQARYILHALLGIMTEAGEMAEALHNTIVGNQPFDAVNLIEECGDVQWYEAMLCRALGTTFDDVQRRNIAKLKARFPDKFTSENANVRDLEKERAILENGYKPVDLSCM